MKKSHILPLILLLFAIFSGEVSAKMDSKSFIEKAKRDLPKECIFFFRMYLNAKSPKAFAYASDNNIKYTCRFSSATNSKAKAKEVALASCEKSRKKRGIKSECRLYNINLKGFISKRRSDFKNKYRLSLKKIEKELKILQKSLKSKKDIKDDKSSKSIKVKEKEKKVKNRISKLPKPCQFFFKLYTISPLNRAFAIAIDNNRSYACKFSANAKTAKKAKELALASCERSRKKRGIKSRCTIFHTAISVKKVAPKPEKKVIKVAKKDIKRDIIVKPNKEIKNRVSKVVKKRHKVKRSYKRVRDKELEKAILNANLREIKRLIKNGADVNTEADDHSRALFVATAKGDIKFVKELLDMGADPYFKKGDGNNLLVAAIMSGKLEMLKLILDEGVDPNEQCNEGNTPLHFAFMMFDDKMMRELYKHGAVDDIPNDKGETVKSMAKIYNVNLDKIKH